MLNSLNLIILNPGIVFEFLFDPSLHFIWHLKLVQYVSKLNTQVRNLLVMFCLWW